MSSITLENVRTNNLKGINLKIDPHQITMICGVSGSGKSSLAFDTLYAAGQQRFLETLSSSARELLGRIPPPEADRIEGVPPSIALRQDEPVHDARATVGTMTDLSELVASYYAAVGDWMCPRCDDVLSAKSSADVVQAVTDEPDGAKLVVGFPANHLGGTPALQLEMLQAGGFARAVVDGRLVRLSDAHSEGVVFGVVDRIRSGQTDPARIAESTETAFRAGSGAMVLLHTDEAGRWEPHYFQKQLSCRCGYVVDELLGPETLSHRSPRGICLSCQGTGQLSGTECNDCEGSRLNEWSSRCVVDDKSMASVVVGPTEQIVFSSADARVAVLSAGIKRRQELLVDLGLGHLSLSRSMASLSSGERIRVRLAGLLAADTVDTLFVLDEPTASLHPADVGPVVQAIQTLRESGNGVVLVEHSPALLDVCDRVVEIGPEAGRVGGEVVFDGDAEQFRSSGTETAQAFQNPPEIGQKTRSSDQQISFQNLATRVATGLAFEIPLAAITVVTGVSGAGKTSLLEAICNQVVRAIDSPDRNDAVDGVDELAHVEVVKQEPLSKSRRSCIATHTKAFDEVRKLFASVPEAQARGMTPKFFSFNTAGGGGRCETCQGAGQIHVAMGHLSDISMTCPRCGGSRYEPAAVAIKYRRRSIADVLEMTVDDAVQYFRTESTIRRRLQPVREVGLGYLTLGQPLDTLSGGEAQRLQLASHLTATSKGRTLFLLDEPARGLHPVNARDLGAVFGRLAEIGHAVVIAEHQLDLVTHADQIIDLDEVAITFRGSPEELLRRGQGATAEALRATFTLNRS